MSVTKRAALLCTISISVMFLSVQLMSTRGVDIQGNGTSNNVEKGSSIGDPVMWSVGL